MTDEKPAVERTAGDPEPASSAGEHTAVAVTPPAESGADSATPQEFTHPTNGGGSGGGGAKPPTTKTASPTATVSAIWPLPFAAASPAALVAVVVAGAIGMVVMPFDVTGIGISLTGLAVAGAAAVAGRGWLRDPVSAVAAALALLLLVVGVLRGAEWLAVLCALAAFGVASLALAGGSRWPGVLLGTAVMPVAAPLSLVWAGRGLVAAARQKTSRTALRTTVVAVVTFLLLVVFGALFASADVVFGTLVGSVLPDLDTLPARIVLFCVVTGVALIAAAVASAPPRFDAIAAGPPRPLRRYEWLVPLALLDLLFGIFVAVQVSTVLGGHKHVLETAGLSYAEYARQGFAQLVVVTVLTLGVLAVAARKAPRDTRTDRVLVRVLLGTLTVLALAIAVSALRRMHLYDDAYGATRLRLLATAFELWVCLIFGYVLVAGVRLRGAWVPRTVVATGVIILLGLAVLNPDRWIAERNIARDKVDLAYLATLSADAVPALDRLPEPQRSCVLRSIAYVIDSRDSWRAFNVARYRARQLLREHPYRKDASCEGVVYITDR